MKHLAKKRVTALIAIIAITGIVFGAVRSAQAAFVPFGGRIITAIPGVDCVAIIIGPPKPGIYVFRWGISILYMWWNILTPGNLVLGTATIPVPCFMSYVPPVFIVGLFIIRVGTSLK